MSNNAKLIEAVQHFSNNETCNSYMRKIRWKGGVPECIQCGASGERIGEIKGRPVMQCKDCRKQFSHKLGTIFEDSKLGLDKWFVAVWALANFKNGISSNELARAISVTQKTAWFMMHRIRKAMEFQGVCDKLEGSSEADTNAAGGLAQQVCALNDRKLDGCEQFIALLSRLVRTQHDSRSQTH
jgi:transposase-like protein